MSTTLDDFFGDSKTATKECLYCGSCAEVLVPAISDNNGVSHWKHISCELEARQKSSPKQLTRVNSTDEMEDQ